MKNFAIILFVSLVSVSCSTHQSKSPAHATQTVLKPKLAISSSEPLASQAGAEVFKAGGNIVDAAVAASLAISVVRPQSTGIGGGGFLLYHRAKLGETKAFDFREVAPLDAEEDMYLDGNDQVIPGASTTGAKAVAVPGLIAGLYDFHKKYGKLSWEKVVQPSIQLAESAIPVSRHMAKSLSDAADEMAKDPELKAVFFKRGRPLHEGETFTQPNLAKTLKQIAEKGKAYFYEGDFAVQLAVFMKKNGGLINQDDLVNYEMKEREPLRQSYRNFTLLSFPPPSSGGINLFQILKIYDSIPESFKRNKGSHVAEIEAMKRAFIDRAYLLGDTDFIKVPVQSLLAAKYFKKRALEISQNELTPSAAILPWTEEKTNHETTHLSLMDAAGNTISTTQSINGYFGAKVVVPGTGVLLNNTMDDFSIQPGSPNQFGLVGGRSNRIQPEKRPLSSMTPTIVLDDRSRPVLALGAPGGSRIITGVYYVLSRILRENQSPEAAVAGCRFHHQWMPDKIMAEEECLNDFRPLEKFYKVEKSSPFGEVQVVGKNSKQVLYSVVDPRGQGQAWLSE